ncbi:hypothetical protein [Aliikangiella maris]|uniref:Uncharacterized protein n=2 Tax=Aliikangiella maris TaxID=3162458 RepID=A0ABV2BZS5_9GAMM
MVKNFQSPEDLSGQPKEITALFESESDRGAILIMAAYLEEILGCNLASYCVSEDAANDIMDFRGPAGGFDLKIRLSFALGLLHEEEKKGLEAIRKIRNAAAHFDRKKGFNVLFDAERTQALVHNLAATQNIDTKTDSPSAIKQLFFLSVRLLASKLFARGLEIVAPQEPTTLKEKANKFRKLMAGTEHGDALAKMEEEARNGNLDPFIKLNEEIKKQLEERLGNNPDEKDKV